MAEPCPCGGGRPYVACCGPLHDGRPAVTAEALMRSRYSAYARGHHDHVFRTWHPRTRPADLPTGAGAGATGDRPGPVTWLGLRVLRTEAGGADDDTGVVEFEARFRTGGRTEVVHETSRFERRAGRWVYVDGDLR